MTTPDPYVIPQRRPRGWTFELGLPDLVAPFVSPVPLAAYRRLLDGGPAAEEAWRRHGSGLLYYAGLGSEAAQALLERLPEDELVLRQNDSPTLGAFLRSAAAHPGVVELHGYCVGPDRADERFSVEGVLIYAHLELNVESFDYWEEEETRHTDACECRELWRIAQEEYGLADALRFPDEIGPFSARWRKDEYQCWRLWWD